MAEGIVDTKGTEREIGDTEIDRNTFRSMKGRDSLLVLLQEPSSRGQRETTLTYIFECQFTANSVPPQKTLGNWAKEVRKEHKIIWNTS